MKNLLTILIIGMMAMSPLLSQTDFYNFTFTFGMSPKQTPLQNGLIVNRETPMTEFVFNLNEVESSYLLGVSKNFRFNHSFFGTVGLQYRPQKQTYSMLFTHADFPDGNEYSLSTTTHMISLPVGVGVKFNHLDITSGLQANYAIQSEMKEQIPMGIEMGKSNVELGWYTGVGISYFHTRFGIQYESTLVRSGHNLMHNQRPMEINNVPGNVTFSLGFSF